MSRMSSKFIVTDTENIPINPLQEKWDKLYPPIPKPEYSQVCDGYSCMWCGRCPRGEYWVVPEEDRNIYEAYKQEVLNLLQEEMGELNEKYSNGL